MEIILVYLGRRCWCQWTRTSPGVKGPAAEWSLNLRLQVVIGDGEPHTTARGTCQGGQGSLALGELTTQAELPCLWLFSPDLRLPGKEHWGAEGGGGAWNKRRKILLKNSSGLNANLRQLLMLNNNIKDLLSLPAPSSSTTTERTVKRPRVGGRPTRTKELAAGKTTCALSNSSQNNPFPPPPGLPLRRGENLIRRENPGSGD